MKNHDAFLRAYVRTKGNMSVNDFLNNGYSMDDFLRFTTNAPSFEVGLKLLGSVPQNKKIIDEMMNNSTGHSGMVTRAATAKKRI